MAAIKVVHDPETQFPLLQNNNIFMNAICFEAQP